MGSSGFYARSATRSGTSLPQIFDNVRYNRYQPLSFALRLLGSSGCSGRTLAGPAGEAHAFLTSPHREKMRTRGGGYQSPADGITFNLRPVSRKRMRHVLDADKDGAEYSPNKKKRFARRGLVLEDLPDDLLQIVARKVAESASKPSDLLHVLLTSRRFASLVAAPPVLEGVSEGALNLKSKGWSSGAHRFLNRCALAGSREAAYRLGMITFYCLEDWQRGAKLVARAAMMGHSKALHCLAIIHFNGSGGSRNDRDLVSGVVLLAKAAAEGHVDALRELGHCLQDGYGMRQYGVEGRRLLAEACLREAAGVVAEQKLHRHSKGHRGGYVLKERPRRDGEGGRDMGRIRRQVSSSEAEKEAVAAAAMAAHRRWRSLVVSAMEVVPGGRTPVASYGIPHIMVAEMCEVWYTPNDTAVEGPGPVHSRIGVPGGGVLHIGPSELLSGGERGVTTWVACCPPTLQPRWEHVFLAEWFSWHSLEEGRKLCCHVACGRPETRRREFRCCSACGDAKYCSRACQAQDWKGRHKGLCGRNGAGGEGR